MRIGIPLQISYQSDLDKAMEIMRQAAENHPRVLKDPEPKAFLKAFGENGIDLELDIWINDPEEGQLNLRSDINLEIWRQFQLPASKFPIRKRDIRIIGNQPD